MREFWARYWWFVLLVVVLVVRFVMRHRPKGPGPEAPPES